MATLQAEARAATADELQVLARWSSWGAVPGVFDESKPEWAAVREQLRELLDDDAYAAARRTTINAHYTDPAVVEQVWQVVTDLGFTGGRVLEPGCGSGTFLGLAPAGADMVGVELDPSTAAIAAALYPGAEVRAESFAATRAPAGSFDAVVGNVPFADVVLHDPQHNRGGHTLHNHFIIKSLELTRPGGLVAVLSSRYTLDAANPAARREMHALADLVGAVRLPTGTHRRAAGTDVVTDVLVLRRRLPGEASRSDVWETTGPLRLPAPSQPDSTAEDVVVRVNSYFLDHPEHVLGEWEVGHGMYGAQTLHVRADDLTDVPARLQTALAGIAEAARADGLVWAPPTTEHEAVVQPAALVPAGEHLWDGHLVAHADGTFTEVVDGAHRPLPVPGTQTVELRALLGLRDAARELLSAEAATVEDSPALDGMRADLAARYEEYAAAYGPINRYALRPTGRVDAATGEPKTARVVPPVMRTFRGDPFSSLVRALEHFDDASQTARPADIMRQRVVVPRAPVLGADTAEDALAITLETTGRVDLDEVARLLGVPDPGQARTALGTLVYDDPGRGGQLVPAAEYLSGDVRAKLETARAAAAEDPDRYGVNVPALEAVVPADLGMDDVEARLGAAWIDAATHQQFLAEVLDDPSVRVEHPGGAVWEVKGYAHSVESTSTWGTRRMPAPELVKAVLEQRPIQVMDADDDDRRVLNPVETAAAQEKAAALQERFAEWVWEDPDRGRALLAEYNRRFNGLVLRDYTRDGQRLTLPGLVATFFPREHQRAAVARMISEPAVGLFHQVGAGKTAEMVIGTMELRRLGMVTKPAVVVPNHMLEQFTREWLQLYPQARILAASTADLAGDKRRQFVARAATNDWDAVVMTRTAFERLPMSRTAQAAYVGAELDDLRAMLERSRGGEGLAVKRLEKMVLAGEQRLAERLDGAKDAGLTFEETGIDYLVVDEMHDYKNLRTPSNIRDAAIEGSKRATDLHMKIEYLRERHGDRVITAATATPIANSITEAHVMQRYLRPDLLRAAGVESFDAWAATFGQTVTEMEVAPTGGGNYRQATRFARFQNVPEMLRMWHVFADVKTAEDLNLPTPALAPRPGDGQRQPETVIVEPSPELVDYVAHLADLAEQVKSRAVDAATENMLTITTKGRAAALDLRLVGSRGSGTTKLDVVADRVASIWREHAEAVYTDPATGQPSPTRGALQLVFCDLGTPSDSWNAYDELRDQLAARGVPRSTVRFMHEAKTDVDKGRLFAAARAGQVAVLIGSTQKMGVGTNVQDRAVALHHVDCPWRPADLEQRDGRIIRQGNQNPEVRVIRYATEGSFDVYSWQTVERKARFIAQIMRGRLDVREINDIGDSALSFAEVKALASGDPLILAKANADADLAKLERLARAHDRNQQMLRQTVAGAGRTIAALEAEMPAVTAAVAATVPTRGEAFTMRVTGAGTVTSRPDAAEAARAWIRGQLRYGTYDVVPLGTLGELGGHQIIARQRRHLGTGRVLVDLHPAGLPRLRVTLDEEALRATGHGIVTRLENALHTDLPALPARLTAELDKARRDQAKALDGIGVPFKHHDDLLAARALVAEISQQMQQATDSAPAAAPTEASGAAAVLDDVVVDVRGQAAVAAAFAGRPRLTPGAGSAQAPAPSRAPDAAPRPTR